MTRCNFEFWKMYRRQESNIMCCLTIFYHHLTSVIDEWVGDEQWRNDSEGGNQRTRRKPRRIRTGLGMISWPCSKSRRVTAWTDKSALRGPQSVFGCLGSVLLGLFGLLVSFSSVYICACANHLWKPVISIRMIYSSGPAIFTVKKVKVIPLQARCGPEGV